ncbi:hypothetical protein NL676_009060 [Syzygium grande]|nr:hypothetical protein NL676_009060 [Syzygium grande]
MFFFAKLAFYDASAVFNYCKIHPVISRLFRENGSQFQTRTNDRRNEVPLLILLMETEASFGKTVESASSPSGSVAPEQKSEDEVEVDGDRLQVPEVLRDADRGEPEAPGATGTQDLLALLHAAPLHHPHHVLLM